MQAIVYALQFLFLDSSAVAIFPEPLLAFLQIGVVQEFYFWGTLVKILVAGLLWHVLRV